MTKFSRKNVPDAGIDLYQSGIATDRATLPGEQYKIKKRSNTAVILLVYSEQWISSPRVRGTSPVDSHICSPEPRRTRSV